MRQYNLLARYFGAWALILISLVALMPRAQAQLQFGPADWILHRGSQTRGGANADPGLGAGVHLDPTWYWPSAGDMPAEIVVDNDNPAAPIPLPVTGQSFTVNAPASWTYTSPGLNAANP